MTFIGIDLAPRQIPGEGKKDAKICIIGEAGGAEENRQLRPFVGPAGGVLDTCLHAAGLTRQDCYITNVVKLQPKGNDISPFFKVNNRGQGQWSQAGLEWCQQLYGELAELSANILVPLGATALHAICGVASISKYRGYVLESNAATGRRKVIPAYHPAASLRGQYILRYYITADLQKAKKEAEFPEIRRPIRKLVVPETLQEVLAWLDTLRKAFSLAIDIEVVNYEVSAIGFAPTPEVAVSIPMYHEHWTLEEECIIWRHIAELLGDDKVVKIFQNGIFDIHFLAARCGIIVSPPIEDTMIAHSIQYPEMLKGLGFLVSLHCGAQEYYKDMVQWDNIKKEA
jgi:uracil-DNA glycosylase family 4